MIYDFPFLYEDELLYSVLGRYHQTSGNKSVKKTIFNLFNKTTIIPVIDMPCNIEKLCDNLPEELGYNSDYIINKCTLFPLYSPFMAKEKRFECISIIKYSDGKGIKLKMGIIAGSICHKQSIHYCPECAKFESKLYDETYLHRLHQVQGVYICEKHLCKLIAYNDENLNKWHFCYIDSNIVDEIEYFDDSMFAQKLLKLVEEIKYIFNNNIDELVDESIVFNIYYKILLEKGYITAKGNIRKSKLVNDFLNYYGSEFLKYLDSEVDISKNNWLNTFFYKSKRAIHPIRHILLIDFLYETMEKFINYEEKQVKYPCMNKFCNYYKDDAKTKFILSNDSKVHKIIVNIMCEECGFAYSRKYDADIYKIGRIKEFGTIWMNKLLELIFSGKPLKDIAKEMSCDQKTVLKYADKMGYRHLIYSNIRFKNTIKTQKNNNVDAEDYKSVITDFIKENPNTTIIKIKQNFAKEYSWLYRNDKKWIEYNLPKPQGCKIYKNNRVDWNKRDEEILIELKKEYRNIKESGNSIRITKTLLAKKINKLACIEKQIDKLPFCKMFLESVVESVEDFQIKRVDTVCLNLYMNNESLIDWKIKKLAHLNSISDIVQERIYYNLKYYSD